VLALIHVEEIVERLVEIPVELIVVESASG